MVKQYTITLNDWVGKEIVGKVKNKSKRIEELIIKGYMNEKIENIKLGIKKAKTSGKSLDSYHSHENVPAFSEFVNIPNLSKGFTDFIY